MKMEKIKNKYIELLVLMICSYMLYITQSGLSTLKDYAMYPITNRVLDSLQERKIKNIENYQKTLSTKAESNSLDSAIFIELKIIKNNQIVFQNKVIDRYDRKCEDLSKGLIKINENVSEVRGILKGGGFISLDSLINSNILLIVQDTRTDDIIYTY